MPAELLVGFESNIGNGHHSRRTGGEPAVMRLMEIIRAIKAWAPTVEDRLLKAYLAPIPEGLRLFAIPRNPSDSSALVTSLSHLSITLCDAGFDLSVRVIPDGTPEELQAFLDLDSAFLFSWR